MEVARTPDDRFKNLEGYPWEPHYLEVPSGASSGVKTIRIHYIDEGPRDAAETIVCMHGQPSWSYLYRKMVTLFLAAGHRVICPDLVGFGRSDKPTKRTDYTYAAHTEWMNAWFRGMDLKNVTLVAQDWGGLIGLRVVAANESMFSRVCIGNTSLPEGPLPGCLAGPVKKSYEQLHIPTANEVDVALHERPNPSLCAAIKMGIFRQPMSPGQCIGFLYYIKWCSDLKEMHPRELFAAGKLTDAVLDGYAAPFPEEDKERYLAGARQFPSLVPLFQDGGFRGEARDVTDNTKAWKVLEKWEKPFLCWYSDGDPVNETTGGQTPFVQRVPGAKKTKHVTIKGGGHFLQEDRPKECAEAVLELIDGKRTIA